VLESNCGINYTYLDKLADLVKTNLKNNLNIMTDFPRKKCENLKNPEF